MQETCASLIPTARKALNAILQSKYVRRQPLNASILRLVLKASIAMGTLALRWSRLERLVIDTPCVDSLRFVLNCRRSQKYNVIHCFRSRTELHLAQLLLRTAPLFVNLPFSSETEKETSSACLPLLLFRTTKKASLWMEFVDTSSTSTPMTSPNLKLLRLPPAVGTPKQARAIARCFLETQHLRL